MPTWSGYAVNDGPRRVAVVHDWLTTRAGSEQVLERILDIFPEADLHALVCYMPGEPPGRFAGRPVRTSFIQRLPLAARRHRAYLPLFPIAIEQFDLSAYDLVISSSHCVAKGVLTGPDQLHICYCYSPARYAWDLQHQYLRESGLGGLRGLPVRSILHRFRIWDARTAHGVDCFATLSDYIARRIRKCYGRDSVIIHPPVEVERFPCSVGPRRGFVTASRMVPYKRMPLIVEAFAGMPDLPLTVIGDGPDMPACVRAAAGCQNIRLLGHAPREVLQRELSSAEAFIFAAEEDFGIAPLEAQACGTPVIAFGRGGATETIRDGITGRFFAEQSTGSIRAAVRDFLAGPRPDPALCRTNAERFAPARFTEGFSALVGSAWRDHRARIHGVAGAGR